MSYRPHGISRPAVGFRRPQPKAAYKRGLSDKTRLSICDKLLLQWPIESIASSERCSETAVRNVLDNLRTYGSVRKPPAAVKPLGRPLKIREEDAEALFGELVRSGWMYNDEIVHWLCTERGITVNRSTISRFLKQQGWSRRSLRPFSLNRNEELREGYRRTMARFAAEDLVFLDEVIFNEKTGWRQCVYGPIGHQSRYSMNINRGETWSMCAAYTINGYLPEPLIR